MANVFDQFDAQQVPAQGANVFDQFDAPQDKNLSARISDAYQKRKGLVGDSALAYNMGEQSYPETVGQTIGKGIIGFGNDVIGETLGSAARYIPEPVKQGAKSVLHSAENLAYGPFASYADDAKRNVADYATSEYKDFAANNPRSARNVEALGNIGALAASFTPIKGTSIANTALEGTKAAASGVGKLASAGAKEGLEYLAEPKKIPISAEGLQKLGKTKYAEASATGDVFSTNLANSFTNAIEEAKPGAIAGSVQTELAQDLEKTLGKYKGLKDKTLTIDEIDIIDKDLSDIKHQAYSAGKNAFGSEVANIQSSLRAQVNDFPGGQALSEARDLFRRKYQMDDIEKIFRRAEGRPNETNVIQTGFRNLANQARKKGSGYSKEQIKLIDKAAKGGLSIDALKFASGRLLSAIAGGVGGAGTGAAVYAGNLAAGAGATALQTAKARKVANTITKGLTEAAEPSTTNKIAQKILQGLKPTAKEIGKMKPAEVKATMNLLKQTEGMDEATLRAFIEGNLSK